MSNIFGISTCLTKDSSIILIVASVENKIDRGRSISFKRGIRVRDWVIREITFIELYFITLPNASDLI